MNWMQILAFLGASISLLTVQLDYITPASRVFGGGAGAFATGYIILIIIQVYFSPKKNK